MSAEEKDRYQKREKKKFEKSLICKKEKKKTHRENSDKQKNRKDSDLLEIRISIQLSWLYRP